MKATSIALAVLVTALAGCASPPDPNSFGGKLAQEGGAVAAIGQDWTDAQERIAEGRDLIETGEKRVDRGENQIEKGRKAINRGEDEIAEGRKMIADGQRASATAEERYRGIVAATSRTPVPE